MVNCNICNKWFRDNCDLNRHQLKQKKCEKINTENINNFGNDRKHEKNWDKEYLLGFYRSFHRFPDNWGIYLMASGQARRMERN